MRFKGTIIAASTLVASLALAQISFTPDLQGRIAFAQAYSQLKYGMTKQQVVAFLGKPDAVHSVYVRPYQSDGASEYWFYGVAGEQGYPTLGTVSFDLHGLLESFPPRHTPSSDLPDEATTRRVIENIAQVGTSHIGAYRFNDLETFSPLQTIRAANAVTSLGQKQGWAILDEFFNTGPMYGATSEMALLCLLRTVFEVPQSTGYLPAPRVGMLLPQAPADPRMEPRYPWTLEQGIPFNLAPMSGPSGFQPPLPEDFEALRKISNLRTTPLIPTDRPWMAADELAKTPFVKESDVKLRPYVIDGLRQQVVMLLETVISDPGLSSEQTHYRIPDAEWQKFERKLDSMHIKWSEDKQEYTLADGSTRKLPPFEQEGPFFSWAPDNLKKYKAVFVIHRIHGTICSVDFYCSATKDDPLPKFQVKMVKSSDPKHFADLFETRTSTTGSGGTILELNHGESVKLVLTMGSMMFVGPAFEP